MCKITCNNLSDLNTYDPLMFYKNAKENTCKQKSSENFPLMIGTRVQIFQSKMAGQSFLGFENVSTTLEGQYYFPLELKGKVKICIYFLLEGKKKLQRRLISSPVLTIFFTCYTRHKQRFIQLSWTVALSIPQVLVVKICIYFSFFVFCQHFFFFGFIIAR